MANSGGGANANSRPCQRTASLSLKGKTPRYGFTCVYLGGEKRRLSMFGISAFSLLYFCKLRLPFLPSSRTTPASPQGDIKGKNSAESGPSSRHMSPKVCLLKERTEIHPSSWLPLKGTLETSPKDPLPSSSPFPTASFPFSDPVSPATGNVEWAGVRRSTTAHCTLMPSSWRAETPPRTGQGCANDLLHFCL